MSETAQYEKLKRANNAVDQGNYDEAGQLAAEVMAANNASYEEHIQALIVLIAANRLQSRYALALQHAENALSIADEHNHPNLKPKVWNLMGSVYANTGRFDLSLDHYRKALEALEKLGMKADVARVEGNIGNIYRNLGNYDMALDFYTKALETHEALGARSSVARVMGNIGNLYRTLCRYDMALAYQSKALAMHNEFGEKPEAAIMTGNMGVTYSNMGRDKEALDHYERALAANEALGNKSAAAVMLGNIGLLYAKKEDQLYNAEKAESYMLKSVELNEELGAPAQNLVVLKTLAAFYAGCENGLKAYEYFEKFYKLENEIKNEAAHKQATQLTVERERAEREKEIAVERARAEEHKKILDNILPHSITNRIMNGENRIADYYENVSVFFSDIVGFTRLSQKVSPDELVEMLNQIFTEFDRLARKYGLEKIKTIGDAYMAAAGVPNPADDHAARVADFALAAIESMKRTAGAKGDELQIRIGLHCGSVVAGVIGEDKFTYDLWGDAVNTAARMESHGTAGQIQVTEAFKNAAGDAFAYIDRGEIEVKGKGATRTYYLIKKE